MGIPYTADTSSTRRKAHQYDMIRDLTLAGFTSRAIASQVGVTHTTVWRSRKAMGISPPSVVCQGCEAVRATTWRTGNPEDWPMEGTVALCDACAEDADACGWHHPAVS